MAAVAITCDCGGVTVTVLSLPGELNACSCRFCARMGAHWGYHPQGDVTISGPTQVYRRARKVLAFHRCVTCGSLMAWQGPNPGRMGVNMAHADPQITAAIPVVDRYRD